MNPSEQIRPRLRSQEPALQCVRRATRPIRFLLHALRLRSISMARWVMDYEDHEEAPR